MKLLKELVAERTLVERKGRWVSFLMFTFSSFYKTCSVTAEESWRCLELISMCYFCPSSLLCMILYYLDVSRLGLRWPTRGVLMGGLNAKLLGRKRQPIVFLERWVLDECRVSLCNRQLCPPVTILSSSHPPPRLNADLLHMNFSTWLFMI